MDKGVNGNLIPANYQEALYAGLRNHLNDPSVTAQYAENVQQSARKFSFTAVAQKLREFINKAK